RRRHTRFSRDWSSDVCSSDLAVRVGRAALAPATDVPPADGTLERDAHHLDARVDLVEQRIVHADESEEGLAGRGQDRDVEAAVRSEERRVGKEGRTRWSLET